MRSVLPKYNTLVFDIFLVALLISNIGLQSTYAQTPRYTPNDEIFILKGDGTPIENPYTGGIERPVFSNIDLNNDGIDELVAYDAQSFVYKTFVWQGEYWKLDNGYSKYLPPATFWSISADLDCDGIMDFITYESSSFVNSPLSVYLGHYENDTIRFSANGVIEYEAMNGNVETIRAGGYGIPMFKDIDSDGDIDILAFNLNTFTLYYYENVGDCNDIKYRLVNECWGDIKLNDQKSPLTGVDCNGFAPPPDNQNENERAIHFDDYSLDGLDIDLDGDLDIFLGNSYQDNLCLLYNENNLIYKVDSLFPVYDEPSIIPFNLLPRLVNIDDDPEDELIVIPFDGVDYSNLNHIWAYDASIGSDSIQFELITKQFIQNKSIDLSTHSSPTIVDFDNDGLLDILISSTGTLPTFLPSSINFLLQNQGSPSLPSYIITDDNYRTSSVHKERYVNTFGDLNGDGHDDLIKGNDNGDLLYFERTGAAFDFVYKETLPLNLGKNATPFLFDIDNDGLLDLVVGERNGNLNLLKNMGTISEPNFVLHDEFWGEVDVRATGQPTGYSHPYIYEYQDRLYLFVASEAGTVKLYEKVAENESFKLLNASILGMNVGKRATISGGFLFDDDFPALLIGNQSGGITIFRFSDFTSSIANQVEEGLIPEIKLYPNPFHYNFSLKVYSTTKEKTKIYIEDTSGKRIYQKTHVMNKGSNVINIQSPQIPAGIYFLTILSKNTIRTSKLVKS